MKKYYSFSISMILIILFVSPGIDAQDLSNFELLAHYTLINTAADETGRHTDITLINAVFQGDDGVYSTGNYIYGDSDSCLVETPAFHEWNFTKLGFSVDFKYEDQNFYGPVLCAGASWRWLCVWVNSNSLDMVPNSQYSGVTDITLEHGRWYNVTFIFESDTGKMFLDGTLIEEQAFTIITDSTDYDKKISNTHFGMGSVFKGNLKNLKIYGQKNVSVEEMKIEKLLNLGVFPNPNPGEFFITIDYKDSEPCIIEIFDNTGKIIYQKKLLAIKIKHRILLPDIPKGFVNLVIKSGKGNVLVTKKVIMN